MAGDPEEIAARCVPVNESFWTWEPLPVLPVGYRACRFVDDVGDIRYGYESIANHPSPTDQIEGTQHDSDGQV